MTTPPPSATPTVSVLMPAYNAERHVAEAVESILAQTFSDFEFLIVDDGSTDGTRGILERLAASDPRIALVSRPNTGYLIALNEMLGRSRGGLLARMDADDVAHPDRFERQVAFLRARPDHVLVGSRVTVIDPNGKPLTIMGELGGHEQLDRGLLEGRGQLIYHPSVMMRREAVLRAGGYDGRFELAEDLDLFLKMAEFGRLANLPEPLLSYREHLSKVGHLRAVRQGEICRAVLVEAHERRGLPVPDSIRRLSFRPVAPADRYRTWAWWALQSGNIATARRHARSAMAGRPLSPSSWRLMYCTLRGR